MPGGGGGWGGGLFLTLKVDRQACDAFRACRARAAICEAEQ